MKREAWLGLYDKLAGLIEKLPGGLQKPIFRELRPIRETFLENRPARVLLLGPAGASVPELFFRLAGDRALHAGESEGGWREYRVEERGAILILDGRDDVPEAFLEAALQVSQPDVALLVGGAQGTGDLGPSARRMARVSSDTPVTGIASGGFEARAALASAASAIKAFSGKKIRVLDGDDSEALADGICGLLPHAAQLEFARLTNARKAQAQIARSLLKSFTAVCGVIGLQPIPLADLPVLVTLQTLMVALVIHTSGRRASIRLVIEFLAALGVNIGAGLVFREGARAMLKVVPFWGHAVSGFVAGAGTYAIGRAAIAYFIEETPMTETRKLFRKLLPPKKSGNKPPPLPPAGKA